MKITIINGSPRFKKSNSETNAATVNTQVQQNNRQ